MIALAERCPNCAQKAKSTHGAVKALTRKALPKSCKELLAWWLSSNFQNSYLTKDEIENYYKGTTATALIARVSELYALDLVQRHDKAQATNPRVTYILNLPKALAVLNNGGALPKIANQSHNHQAPVSTNLTLGSTKGLPLYPAIISTSVTWG